MSFMEMTLFLKKKILTESFSNVINYFKTS